MQGKLTHHAYYLNQYKDTLYTLCQRAQVQILKHCSQQNDKNSISKAIPSKQLLFKDHQFGMFCLGFVAHLTTALSTKNEKEFCKQMKV